jgi:Na+/H+-translocating membrane pyrophosphatase
MISFSATVGIIYASCGIGLIWAFINYLGVKSVNLHEGTAGDYTALSDDGGRKKVEVMLAIGEYIARGANAFLYQEYKIVGIFCAVMAVLLWVSLN